jgi:polysaccharide export outer membrane protein
MRRIKVLLLMVIFLLCISFVRAYAEESTYRVGINDIIGINVAGHPDFSTTASVLLDGTISYPYLGVIYVNGMSLSEIKDLITKRLSEGYVKSPIVTVSLKSSASKRIYFYGEVSDSIPYEKDITIGKAVILKGIDKEKYDLKIIKRDKKGSIHEVEIDIRDIMEGQMKDILLRPDDIIVVKSRESFFIQGEVGKPGKYILKDDITVLEAITEAGGVKETGLYGDVLIRRKREHGAGYDDIKVDLKGIMKGFKEDIPLRPDDIVVVKPNNTFIIFGEVYNPGEYVLEDDMTVGRAIAKAGGIKEGGLYGRVKVRRIKKDGSGYEDIEVDLRRIIEGTTREDILLQPDDILIVERNNKFLVQGAVINPGEYVLEDNMTLGKAIAKAGGVSDEGLYGKVKIRRIRKDNSGYDDIEYDLKDVIDGDAGNMSIMPDDIIMVEKNKTFMIYGEVRRIGEFPLSDGMTVFKAITMAGGFSKWGSPSRIKILRPNKNKKEFDIIKVNVKKVINGDASADIPLQPGDIVIVSSSFL